MAEVIRIEGGHKLSGTVRISAAKNATVALIPATVLADGVVTIFGVPNIADVGALSTLLEELNIKVHIIDDHIIMDTREIQNKPLTCEAVSKLRASYYFMGAILGRYKDVSIHIPGGCDFGPRPIDLHLKGFKALGATVDYDEATEIYHIHAKELKGARIYLDFASVGATINIMLAAVMATGRTVIENVAKEPEIIDVANLLTKMGAKIRGAGTDTITIDGVTSLDGCYHEIIPDRIEAGTYLIIAAAMGERVIVDNIIPQHLDALISKLEEMGVEMEQAGDSIIVYGHKGSLKAVDVKTQVYPGFATDLQQPLCTLLTQAEGTSNIRETIYQTRFKQCGELNNMGANCVVDAPKAHITGATPLHGCDVYAHDLRCGAAMLIAGLIADGVTTIHNVHHIDRGYDGFEGKLIALGAKIWRERIDEE